MGYLFEAKKTAYLIAAKALENLKCPPGIFNAEFTKEVNRELKDLPDKLYCLLEDKSND